MNERESKYWICNSCAKQQGLIAADYAVTALIGFCGHCASQNEEMLIPVIDYADPKTGREPIFD